MWTMIRRNVLLIAAVAIGTGGVLSAAHAAPLQAGAAKVDITDVDAGPVSDPLFAKALVLSNGQTTAVLITVDAVAIAEIGTIPNDYLATVRKRLHDEFDIEPTGVLINASHCHGKVCSDVAERTVEAVRLAWKARTPVKVGVGAGHEDRIMENRRLKLKSGREADVRHAYSLPPDEEVADVGPVDPEIGLLRLDRLDGGTVAVVYNFACHPIQGVPSGGNTADLSGFASRLLEEGFGEGAIALFVQGCGGDINPVYYKDVNHPRDAETLGNMLGLSALKAAKRLKCQQVSELKVIQENLELPRADNADRIAALQVEQLRLLRQLKGTSLNLKTFLPLALRQNVSDLFPSYSSHRYLHDRKLGRNDLDRLDAENRQNVSQYVQNIYVMEELTRLQTNLALLEKHQARNVAAGKRTIDVELVGLRVGDFRLITFPGELTVQIGLNLKQATPNEHTFVAGYTNGYIYYAPTAEQLLNVGGAQEDSDCLLAPDWQALFETRAVDILGRL